MCFKLRSYYQKSFFLLQTRQGAELFSYQDAQGNDHFLPGSNCNGNEPTWLMDSIKISDVGVLPVLGIKYGPLLYEEEAAKVIIGPIKCQAPPLASWQEHTLEGRINQNEDKILGLKTEWSQRIIDINSEKEKEIEFVNSTIDELKMKIEELQPLPSQCLQYKNLTDSKRKYNLKDTSNYYCDNTSVSSSSTSLDWIGPNWYRVTGQAGTQLSEHSYKSMYGMCSTHHGGWLVGGHPVLRSQTVTRTVCFYTSSVGSCTGGGINRNEIEVTNCDNYFVYNLKTPPQCTLRYCTQ